MPERDPQDSGASPHTPRVSGEVPARLELVDSAPEAQPQSSARSVQPEQSEQPPALSEPSDTLLSAGKPAERLEVLLEDRLAQVDQRLRELEGRLAVLEQRKSVKAPEPRSKPWLWLVFLIALVVVFQLLRAMR